ncbi:hypothetical protein QQY24_32025 [Streptomyces sp. TG1A-8]|uniref:hypothetical protein n=1 Tax=Streptomyces sp. TG1A-8 TaxID=3051385 RepID=UPI00265C2A30|nr:hypothetical protein [Streptomyces sp. TG1A-8]MDO0929754.1 hypothetical protein [Streptomyces sp. TG1A-8]
MAPEVFPRLVVLGILGAVTLGVALLSVAVSYSILEPPFGRWAVPTVGALDALWCVMQATEILSGNNRVRAARVRWAGLALTAVNAAIPTVDLALKLRDSGAGFELAVVIAPIAIVATKGAWWIALPSLGRRVSDRTRQTIAVKRQQVADRLEEMEADAADRIELLELARELNERVAQAETAYRLSVLETQQSMTEDLHAQAETTADTVAKMPLPASVAAIPLPNLGTWTPAAPALPGTADTARHTNGTQVSALTAPTGTLSGTPGVTPSGTPAHDERLADLAAVAGVPVPVPGEPLTDAQIGVVLRRMRYDEDPPLSYRQARDAFRRARYMGSEERIRHAWAALLANEGHGETEGAEGEEESEEADA